MKEKQKPMDTENNTSGSEGGHPYFTTAHKQSLRLRLMNKYNLWSTILNYKLGSPLLSDLYSLIKCGVIIKILFFL